MINKITALFLIAFIVALISCTTSSKKERKIVPIKTLADVLSNISPNIQTFEITAGKEVLLKGEEGTAIYIPADAFQFADSSIPKGIIHIELKECYKLSAMIAENLSTNSFGRLLETGGMVHIKATAGGKELQVKDGSGLVVGFPKQVQQDSMELFYGIPYSDSASNTWLAELDMFTMGEGFSYDGVLPDSLYTYKLNENMWSGHPFDKLKLKGSNSTIIDYIEDTANSSEMMRQQFANKKWFALFDFSINDKGERYNYKESNYINDSSHNAKASEIFLDLLKAAPAFNLESIDDSKSYVSDCSIGITGDKVINFDAFKIWYRRKMEALKDKEMIKEDKTLLELYMFSVTRLGWINCDKFWDTKDEKINFYVRTANATNVKMQIVFDDIKSIMTGSLAGGQFVFNNLPINRKIKIIGISYKDGKPTMSKMLTSITKKGADLTGYKEFTMDELESNLDAKNN
jgi:hypothetical protein